MIGLFKNFFGKRSLRSLELIVQVINALEPEVLKLSDDDLKGESAKLKSLVASGQLLDAILPRAFALAREAARRTLGQRPYDVQLMGGVALHQNKVVEMSTGEGKTLAAVAPTYLNALSGKGAHVVTVNEYLARRDAVWMGQIYRALGLSVACLVPNAAFMYDPEWKVPEDAQKMVDETRDTIGNFAVQQEYLKPISRREAYLADITYGTNHEFGFDYLRDNLAYRLEDMAQRDYNYAIIDEVDSILIDEARTPLIIAAPDEKSSDFYKAFARIAANFVAEEDYVVEEKKRSVNITEAGIEKVEKVLGVGNLYAPENLRLVHYLEESLKARALFRRDKDYVVKGGEVIIVDEFTGRMLHGRRYQAGLHQAIEAKEGVTVKEESRTYAKISIQNYFRMYKKIAGMTGTAQTSAEEFHKVYNLDVVSIPTNKPMVRDDRDDLIYKTQKTKWEAVVREIAERHKLGQPILVGTTSIERNELVSALLSKAAIKHEVLNAKNNEREGAIIAQAGRRGAVTVATNMAGRGVDIILGGNPPSAEESAKVREVGGLHVVGTERHEARRIDNQLRGRAGRQGDQGSSQFFLSLEDDLMRIFGGDRVKSMMERFNLPEDQPIQLGMVSSVVGQAQSKIEGYNFDLRKHLLEYDDVLNKQRAAVYRRRREILNAMTKEDVAGLVFNSSFASAERLEAQLEALPPAPEGTEKPSLSKIFAEAGILNSGSRTSQTLDLDNEEAKILLEQKSKDVAKDPLTKNRLLGILDQLWMNHLEELDALSTSVGLRAYGQKDPLVEYRQESRRLYGDFGKNFDGWVFGNIFRLSRINANQDANARESSTGINQPHQHISASTKVGRNDPCPCGSGKKYKRCHGK